MNLPPIPFSIEEATLKDLFAIRLIEKECFGEDAWSLLELAGVLTISGSTRLKAVASNKVIGFISGNREFNSKTGWITTLAVLIKYQRRGIAAALLAACEKTLAVPTMRLCVRISNEPAIQLYQHKGYKQIDVRRHYYAGDEDAFVLEKKMEHDEIPS